MTRIILTGCNGRMGKTISSILQSFPHLSIVAGIDKNAITSTYPVFDTIGNCTIEGDVVLDFSRPDALEELLTFSQQKSIPLILCTTGYSKEDLAKIEAATKLIPIFRSANMSLGINVINSVLKQISAMLYNNFDIEIIEKHHNQKVDAPSGTALLLADTIKEAIPEETCYVKGRDGLSKREHKEIGIHAMRGGNIVGDHSVIFAGQGEIIEISHSALSREVFAVGALKACEFMHGQTIGLYSMDDVIKNSIK